MKRSKIREIVFQQLYMSSFHDGAELPEIRDRFLDGDMLQTELEVLTDELTQEEKQCLEERAQSVWEKLPALDSEIDSVSEGWKTGRMASVDLTAIRLALYEMRYDPEVPEGVAINEAVELVKKYGDTHSASFVNAILGKLARTAGKEE